MDFDDLVSELAPPLNRVDKCEGGLEPEGAVVIAFAMHLLRTTSPREVLVHPDGEHGKRFDFAAGLQRMASKERRGRAAAAISLTPCVISAGGRVADQVYRDCRCFNRSLAVRSPSSSKSGSSAGSYQSMIRAKPLDCR
jgi:hypothetical protein